MTEHRSHYTRSPVLPAPLMPRLAAIIQVVAGLKTVSEAAREVNLSRNHFQSILHRTLQGMIATLSAKQAGRPARPQALSELHRRVKRLERHNARLKRRLEATDELLSVAGGLLHGRAQRPRRSRSPASSTGAKDAPEEPGGPHAPILQAIDRLRALGVSMQLAAQLGGYHAATLRRWRAQAQRPKPPPQHLRAPTAQVLARTDTLVRQLHGLVGAASLSHSIQGLTRRVAAHLKAHTVCAMERERKRSLEHLHLTQAGLMRGMDAMHLSTATGSLYALIAADASVPYRTSFALSEHCDANLVVRLIDADIAQHGAPLVLRADRARAHDVAAVREVLDRHQVLMLHGPPHYPCFYGQLERQNREHRAWLATATTVPGVPLQILLAQMLESLNTLWRRPTLGWATAAERWHARPSINPSTRCAFREEVHNRTHRIAASKTYRGYPTDLAKRLAIEQTLEYMGYLNRQIGSRC